MFGKLLTLVFVVTAVYGSACSEQPAVRTGIEVLRESGFAILKGKRVGLITNPTGVDFKLRATIDILHEAKDVTLVALFGPEHGVRGNIPAGQYIEHATDPATGLPAYSLYGKTRKPASSMLKGIDALVYDIQDIGCRSYTYISTMGLAMEAAAENNIEFIVLDRPNPLGGVKVEGNIVEKGFESFVSQYPIPYVYGLTCGELATMLNEEGMLKRKCKLSVVPMRGWKRSMTYAETGLPWVQTSPHIPAPYSPAHYVSMGILGELGIISEGVGYTIPFQTFAAEWIDPKLFADRLNGLGIDGVVFRPITFTPFYGRFKDKSLKGVQIHMSDYTKVNLMSLQFICLQVHNELYPAKNPFLLADSSRISMFDKVAGSSQVRALFTKRMQYDDVSHYLRKDVEPFKRRSHKYLLY
ncbi:MAG: DUF1343 domain-containing protein [Bacteroidetes bacterium]|nr:DUF1343 domain-containing protein [Bacteroidota bacterium]MCW5895203.1 DUF1343 domain-containing protein [Bacteroidota bacterium]